MLNLCLNARDAMPDGGKITVETANRWLDARAARQHDIPEGQFLSLCVSDTGVGMPPDVIARAFEPFFTTKPTGEGTGLGLSMVYGFARQSGGQVRIYSEVGQGATVCIYLPRYYGELAKDQEPATAADMSPSAHSETVLVVDDEPTVRMLVTEILEELGYVAIEAADSVAGLKLLQSDARIDLSGHRRRIAWRNERPSNGGRSASDATGPQGSVHHGLRREFCAGQWASGSGDGGDDEALPHRNDGDPDKTDDPVIAARAS